MQIVLLWPLFHREQEVLAADFPKDREIELAVRKLKGVKWTQTHRSWYLPLNRDNYQRIVQAVKPMATLDCERLKQYLEKRKQVAATNLQSLPEVRPALQKPIAGTIPWQLTTENLAALHRFMETLKLKAYSPSTIKTYRNEFLQLLHLLKQKPVDALTTDDLRRYFVYCFEKLKLTENTLHSRINALKFYFEQAKGKKDRVVVLSPVLLVMLREYCKAYKPSKSGYLFESLTKGEPYGTRSLQLVMAAAKRKAGIFKAGSVHALRHSFATQLLDKGTDVTMIMKLLGHNDIKTTLRYLHVTNRDILHVLSPLDDLQLT